MRDKPKKLRVMAEYTSSGIWVIEQTGPFRHGGVSHETLSLPQELKDRFNDWIQLYDKNLEGKLDLGEFDRIGLGLAQDLKKFMGSDVYVEYEPEKSDFGSYMTGVINREYGKIDPMFLRIERYMDYIQNMLFKLRIIKGYSSLYGRHVSDILDRSDIRQELERAKSKMTKTVVVD